MLPLIDLLPLQDIYSLAIEIDKGLANGPVLIIFIILLLMPGYFINYAISTSIKS